MSPASKTAPPMAAAKESTLGFKTGNWRFEKPVFVEQIAPCSEVCPLGINIPLTMSLAQKGHFKDAYDKILQENPFPGICGEICFCPCEKVCNRRQFDQAVSIKELEAYISHLYREDSFNPGKTVVNSLQKAAVVGSGAAGISCAYFLACLGHQVTIIEPQGDLEIFRMAQGNQLLENILKVEVNKILSLGIGLRCDTPEHDRSVDILSKEFKSVYFSSNAAGIKNQDLIMPRLHNSETYIIDEHCTPNLSGTVLIKKAVDPGKAFIRDMAAGKQAAMALDMSLCRVHFDRIRLSAIGKLGALSMETYRFKPQASSNRGENRTVRFRDINLTDFASSARIEPETSDKIFTQNQAQSSAKRCFNCGICTFCNKCYEYCPDLSIRMDAKQKYREIDYDYCKGCGICVRECPRGAIVSIKE